MELFREGFLLLGLSIVIGYFNGLSPKYGPFTLYLGSLAATILTDIFDPIFCNFL